MAAKSKAGVTVTLTRVGSSPTNETAVATTETLLFVVTHLMTFKFGTVYTTPEGIRDIYRLQVEIFSSPVYVTFYLVAMFIIFSHLWHGLTSAAQSLGADHPQWTPRVLVAGRLLSVAIAGGFFILPIFTFFVSRGAR